ncbi:MAG: cell division protein ZapA [Mariprofundaceae bacterium]
MSHAVEVTLMGQSFTIRTEDNPEQVIASAELLQSRIDEFRKIGATVASDRLMALVALNLAGELLHKKEDQVEDFSGLMTALDDVVSQAEGLAQAPLR